MNVEMAHARAAWAQTLAETRDPEAALLAGYEAELAATARKAQRSDDTGRKTGLFDRIVVAVRNGHDTAPAVAKRVGILPVEASNYLSKLRRMGRLKATGKTRGRIVWAVVE